MTTSFPLQPRRGTRRGFVQAHMPLADQLLDAGTGKAGEGDGQETVQPLSRAAGGNGEAVEFGQPATRPWRGSAPWA